MKAKQAPFYLLIVALFMCFVSPSLLSDGMFVDGVTYAAIAKNLANGLGSFWNLHYTDTLYPHFHEHPPMAIGIQSLFFTIFGEKYLVERIYSLITFLLTGWILAITWTRVARTRWTELGWLPLLFWILIPLVSWAASNNLLENTLMVFTSLSVFLILESTRKLRILYLCLAGLALFLGALTKGFVALFTLMLPAWIWIFGTGHSFRRAAVDTLVLLVALLVPFLVMFLTMPESLESLHTYLESQVWNSLRNVRTVDTRFYILRRLILELIPGLFLVLILYLFTRKRKIIKLSGRTVYWLLALGFSGVLPVMVSLKQRGFYIQATFPVFSLALAYVAAPRVQILLDRLNTGFRGMAIFRYGTLLLLAVGISLNSIQINRVGRDQELIGNIHQLMEVVPPGSHVAVTDETWENWALHAYLQRYAGISLDSRSPVSAPYLLIPEGTERDVPSGYTRNALRLDGYVLYNKVPVY